jgi:uncharacterized OsmC-like protein
VAAVVTIADLEVRATFFRREQVVVQFSRGAWVADHPVAISGDGKGPTPGDLLLGALTASAVIALGASDAFGGDDHHGRTPPVVRAIAQTGRRATDGPLPNILRVDRLVSRAELRVPTTGSEADVREALARCPVRETLRSGVIVRESATLDRSFATPSPHEPNVTPAAVSQSRGAPRAADAAASADGFEWGPPGYHWTVSSVHLGGSCALIQFPNVAHISDSAAVSPLGPSPLEILLAAVAVGATTFVGRFSAQQGIPVARVDVIARAAVEVSPTGVPHLRAIDKELAIRGDLDDEQMSRVRFFCENSALTETIKAGASVDDEIVVLPGDGSASPTRALLDTDQLVSTRSRLVPPT